MKNLYYWLRAKYYALKLRLKAKHFQREGKDFFEYLKEEAEQRLVNSGFLHLNDENERLKSVENPKSTTEQFEDCKKKLDNIVDVFVSLEQDIKLYEDSNEKNTKNDKKKESHTTKAENKKPKKMVMVKKKSKKAKK